MNAGVTAATRHEFIDGYIVAMLGVNTLRVDQDTDEIESHDATGERDELTWDALKWLVRDALTFLGEQHDDLLLASVGRDWGSLGHDFALNRCGHGTGFWDRGLGELGNRLSRAAHVHGEATLLVTWNNGIQEG